MQKSYFNTFVLLKQFIKFVKFVLQIKQFRIEHENYI